MNGTLIAFRKSFILFLVVSLVLFSAHLINCCCASPGEGSSFDQAEMQHPALAAPCHSAQTSDHFARPIECGCAVFSRNLAVNVELKSDLSRNDSSPTLVKHESNISPALTNYAHHMVQLSRLDSPPIFIRDLKLRL